MLMPGVSASIGGGMARLVPRRAPAVALTDVAGDSSRHPFGLPILFDLATMAVAAQRLQWQWIAGWTGRVPQPPPRGRLHAERTAPSPPSGLRELAWTP